MILLQFCLLYGKEATFLIKLFLFIFFSPSLCIILPNFKANLSTLLILFYSSMKGRNDLSLLEAFVRSLFCGDLGVSTDRDFPFGTVV